MIAISVINHSGLFSDNKTHLSPKDKFSFKYSDKYTISSRTCFHVKNPFFQISTILKITDFLKTHFLYTC